MASCSSVGTTGRFAGATKESERQAFEFIRFNPLVNTVCASKVGDVAIDLPEANVIVQVSSHLALERQEAQRLGSILTEGVAEGGGLTPSSIPTVSTDTTEMFYSTKRQQFGGPGPHLQGRDGPAAADAVGVASEQDEVSA